MSTYLNTAMFRMQDLVRSRAAVPTGRRIYRLSDRMIKAYTNYQEAEYEYRVLTEIGSANPSTFKVPSVMNIVKRSQDVLLEMKYIKGCPLEQYIGRFLLCRDSRTLEILRLLGEAIKELHFLDLKALSAAETLSSVEIGREIAYLSSKLGSSGLMDREISTEILKVTRKEDIDLEISCSNNLHGELYFTHVIVCSDTLALLDFHRAHKGPFYRDLATFGVCMGGSVMLPMCSPKQIAPLLQAFLGGYYGYDSMDSLPKQIAFAMLHLILNRINLQPTFCSGRTTTSRIISLFKIARLTAMINDVILPALLC